jgi:tetratricopeptide (TPR) repeat protein
MSRTNEAIDAYEEAIGLFIEAGKYAEAAEASQALGHIHLWRADPARACDVLERAVRACDMTAPAARYPLELLNAVSLGVRGDMAAAFAALEKAKRTEADLADSSPELVGYARMSEAHLCYFSVQAGAAAECARAAVNAFRATGNTWAELETYEVASAALWDGGAATENDAVLSNMLRRAEQIGHRNAIWTYRFMQAELLMHRGELQQAEEAAKQVHDYAIAISAPWAFIDYVLLAAIAHYRGDLSGGAQWSRIALDLEPECYMSGLSSGSLYWNLAAQGDSGAESALALARRSLPAAGQVLTLGSTSCLTYVVEGLATEGRIQEAAALEPAADWVVANGPPWLYSRHVPGTCAGIAAASAHNWARAEEYHRTAIQTADSRGCRVAQPVSRYWYADMLWSRELPGDRERARDLLYETRSLAESMSMAWHARKAATRLASM